MRALMIWLTLSLAKANSSYKKSSIVCHKNTPNSTLKSLFRLQGVFITLLFSGS